MKRRELVTVAGVSISAVIAGCAGGDDDGDDAPESGDDDSPSDDDDDTGSTDAGDGDDNGSDDGDGTDEDDPAVTEYTIEADVPDEIAVGEEFTFSWTVSNDGDDGADGEALYGLDISVAGDDNLETVFEEPVELEAGESETEDSDPFSFDSDQVVQWEFWVTGPGDDSDETRYETAVTIPELAFGETFRTPTDLALTASNPRTADSYEYEDWSGDTQTHESEPGEQFAFVDVTVTNEADETRESPNILSFNLVADGELYDTMGRTEYEDSDEMYDGLNDLPSETSEDGLLPFTISDDADESDLSLYHNDADFDHDAEWEAHWGE